MAGTLRKQSIAGVMTALLLMGGRPGIASEEPRPAAEPRAGLSSWSPDSHVRSSDDRVLKGLRDGVAQSATFRNLIGVLDRSDVIVYIESSPKMRTGFSAYLNHRIVTAGSRRYLWVTVTRDLARNRLVGVIAHELQHAREVAEAADVRSSADMATLFKRINSGKCVLVRSCMETDAAVRLEAAVLDELNAGR